MNDGRATTVYTLFVYCAWTLFIVIPVLDVGNYKVVLNIVKSND